MPVNHRDGWFLVEPKVFFDVVVSLDGFIAPEGMDMEHANDPGYKNWWSKWMALQSWVFQQKFFRENLKLAKGGETGQENQLLEQTFKRTGVTILGKRMFDAGEKMWPEEAPFHTPVFRVDPSGPEALGAARRYNFLLC